MNESLCVTVTAEFGIVVRRKSLVERGVPLFDLLAAMEVSEPLDSNEDLLSFGPHFGQEAMDALSRRLMALELIYFDDFFEFFVGHPRWCTFQAKIAACSERDPD